MNKLDKCGYWLMLSDYDMGTIDALIQGERWVYVAFLCQQATERQLKAMYVYFMEAEPPKTHNVNFLFSKITDGKKTDPFIIRFFGTILAPFYLHLISHYFFYILLHILLNLS